MALIASLGLCSGMFGNTTVTLSGITATQAVLQTTTTNSENLCSYEVSEYPSFAPVVHDVDSALFPNSNFDLQGVFANVPNRVFVVGKRRADTAKNGGRYSRALAASTLHYYRVTCGADVVTGRFTTANPPLGNSYPELPGFQRGAFGNLADPTIDWANQATSYVDPITGVRLWRVTGPGQSGVLAPPAPFDYALDRNGAWSNPQAATGRAAGSFASTTTPNAALFLAWNEIHNYQLTWGGANFNPLQGTIDDLRIRLSGAGPNATVSVCISLDSGLTCKGGVQSVALTSATAAPASPAPAIYPQAMFGGWGRVFSNWEIANRSAPSGASALAGSQSITAAAGAFNVDWPAGVKLKLEGSGCNGNDVCTVASVQNSGQLTTLETSPNGVNNRAWQAYAAGIRVWLSSGQSVSFNGVYEYAESTQNILNDNPSQSYCSELKVSDVYKDRNGRPLATPLSGRLCNFVHGLYLAVDGTGEFRLLSNFFMNSASPLPGQPVNLSTSGAFSASDPKTFYGNAYYNSGVFRGVYTGDYTPYLAGGSTGYVQSNPVDDAIAWTNVIPAGSPADVSVQLASNPLLIPGTSGLLGQPAFNGLLDGYGMFFLGPLSGNDPICEVVRYDMERQKVVQVLTSWTTWPMRWGGCHFSPRGAGSFQIGAFNPINGQNPGSPLNGPFQLNLTQVKKGGQWVNNTALSESVVATASNSSPVVISTASTYTDAGYMGSNPHGLIDGEPVVIWGAESNTVINTPGDATYYVKASWSDTMLASDLPLGGVSFTVADGSRIAPNPMLRIDAELIRCSTVAGNVLSGCVRGVSGSTLSSHAAGTAVHQANSLALYYDQGLTQPIPASGPFSFNGKTFLMDLDPCPASLSSRVSTGLFGDTGPSGRRCNSLRVAGEPVSHFPYWTNFQIGSGLDSITVNGGVAAVKLTGQFLAWKQGQSVSISGASAPGLNGTFQISNVLDAATVQLGVPGAPDGVYNQGALTVKHPTEHYQYPFKGEPGNLSLSSLQDLDVGDFIHDLSGGQFGEQLVVVDKKKNSEADIELTVMRFWGNQLGCDTHLTDSSPMTHANGWTPFMVPSFGCWAAQGYADITDTAWRIGDYHLAEEHGDIGPGNAPGLYTYVSSGGNTPIANVTFGQIMTTPAVSGAIQELPTFGGSAAALPYGYTTQGYGAFRQTAAPPQEKVWKADYHALNNSYGGSQDTPLGLTTGMAFSPVTGTKTVYRITGTPSGVDHKRLPVFGFAGYHYMTDMSGPGSVISDANPYAICVADFAGECRAGSAAGSLFASLPGADFIDGGWCITNGYEYNVPCIFTPNSYGGWAVQQRIDPPDMNASRGRRLTNSFVNPGRHFTFTNWVPSPDGQYGFLSPPWLNGVRNDIFAMRLPPWPAADAVDRSNFVPLKIPVAPLAGAITARAVFGYEENGAPSDLFCTARKESCQTGGSPFSWLSEQPTRQSCVSGCTVSVPAIAGRVVYYRIEWLDGVDRVVSSGPLNAAVAAP